MPDVSVLLGYVKSVSDTFGLTYFITALLVISLVGVFLSAIRKN